MHRCSALNLFGCLSLALLSTSCATGKGDYFRVREFTTDTLLPPLGKLASNALAPIAGRTTHREVSQRFDTKDAQGNSKLGYFTGEPRIIPLGPHLFWFYQPSDPSQQFSFTTYQHSPYGPNQNGETKWTIVPQSMLFDGSSVPRFFWHVKSYGPFDFTKSAIIHDWLFEAHHRVCIYDHALKQNCAMVKPQERQKLQRARAELAMYLECAFPDALDEHGSGRRMPTIKGLSCTNAGWIMMECMLREMKSSEVLLDLTRQAMADAEKIHNPASITRGNALRGLQKQVEPALNISRERKHVLGIYRVAVDYVAEHILHIWNPKPKRGMECYSGHASSLAIIDALRETINSNPNQWRSHLRLDLNDTALSKEIRLLLDPQDSTPKQTDTSMKSVAPAVRESVLQIQNTLQLLRIATEISTSNANPTASSP